MTKIYQIELSTILVKHPFTDTEVSAIPDGKGGVEIIALTEGDAQLKWRQSMYRQIDKKHIYAYFNGRNESEVIVDPSYLTNITKYRICPPIFYYHKNNGGNEMTIYQEEMQRKAQHYGCITSYDEADKLLLISPKGVHLTAINPEGFMFYNSKDLTDPESREVFSHLVDDAKTVREYVGLYESAPQMKPKDVQNYRKLSEYGDAVFAGMYSQKHGFMFCSWRQSDGGRYLAHGDYSPDYISSK